jgi:hypothetical protein
MRRACSVLDIFPLPVALNGETEGRERRDEMGKDIMMPHSVRRLDARKAQALEHYRNIIHIPC